MTWMEAGPLALYPHWAKVQTVRSVLLERRTNVVFLDMDAFLLDVNFCPQWTGDGDSFDKALLIAPDPKPWQQPLNAGFFAVRHNDIGVAIMDAWWQAYETNISSCWAEGATCGMCRRNFTSCIKPCIYGGYCSDQFTLKEAVWPRFQRHFLILPRTFQDTGLGCNGTVKHFAAGFNRRQVVRVLSKCGGSERPSLPSLRQRRADAIDAMLAGTTLQQAHTLIDAAVATSDGPTAAAPTAAAPSRKRPPPAAASSSYLVDWRVRHIHVLSLSRRTDRRELIRAQAPLLPVPLTFVDAFDCGMHPPLVPLNCVHLSWQRALLEAIERDAFPCLITEDDIEMTRVRLPSYTLPAPASPDLPKDVAFIALASNLNFNFSGHCDAAAAQQQSHIITNQTAHAFGFAAQYFGSADGAKALLSFLMHRSSPLDDWADVAAFSRRFGRAVAVCPPLLGYHATQSSTRIGETRVSTIS